MLNHIVKCMNHIVKCMNHIVKCMNHIVKCMDHILAKHPDSGIIIGGDTNRLKDHRLRTGYQLKQLVKEPARGRAILDRVYTNI